MKVIDGFTKRLNFLFLDLIAIPGLIMNKKYNAWYHLKVVCPSCPDCRRELRSVNKKGQCWWNIEWEKGNCDIPRYFGIKNFINQYLFLKTDLLKFRK